MMRIFTAFLLFVYLSSCDCVQEVSGVVVDFESGIPIEGALVRKKEKAWQTDMTSEKGFFQISSISGGLSFGCPDMNILIQKAGYEPMEYSIDAGGHEKIRLTRIKENESPN